MGCLGVHFALTDAQRERLVALDSDEPRIDHVPEDLDESWDDEYIQETDKAWDAVHRRLTVHRPDVERGDPDAGTYPLKLCILGGTRLLVGQDSYINHLIEPNEVADLAAALEPIDTDWLSARYWKHRDGARPAYGGLDMEYTWEYFCALREFMTRVAGTGLSVIFTADQYA